MRWTVPEVSVEAYGRLHAALIDVGRATPRAYGGCGFALGTPVVRVRAKPATSLAVTYYGTLDDRGREDVDCALARLGEHVGHPIDAELTIDGWIPQHVGLGTKTALVLALLDATSRALDLSLSNAELQSISGRGGTSGVGIHTYFCGGFALDAGHVQSRVPTLAPSSSRLAPSIPPMLTWAPFPDGWHVTLLAVPGPRIHGENELAFFAAATPVPADEVLRALALVHHGMTPAFLEEDLERLGSSLLELHQVGFKARELTHQSASVKAALRDCWDHGLVAGLSSMGPTIYAISSSEDDSTAVLETIARTHDIALIGPLPACNVGARVA
jgi:beta-ribofuranosylaminobenzene 5'-phosphate synthase